MNFNTILIPVDFTVNTKVAIRKGIQLCEGPSPEIHLLHVSHASKSGGIFGALGYFNDKHEQDDSHLHQKLKECLSYIKESRNDINATYWISASSMVEKTIAEKAKEITADLVIICKNSQHSILPFLNTVVPSRLAKDTGISVLTVKPGALSGTVRTVVVTMSSKYPDKKVNIINELKKKFYLNIRLLLMVEKDDDPDTLRTLLVNTCLRLHDRPLDTITYDILNAGTNNRDILSYCRKVDADLLIVNPGSETKIGWLNKHISDELPVSSKTQVLAVG